METDFHYSPKIRLLWLRGVAIILFFNGLYFYLSVSATNWNENLISLIVIGLLELSLCWFWLHLFITFSKTITLTDESLIIQGLWQKQCIAYSDIVYGHLDPSPLTRLRLIAHNEEVKIARGLENFEHLYAILEHHVPSLFAPSYLKVSFPWKVKGERFALLVISTATFLCAMATVLLIFASIKDGSFLYLIITPFTVILTCAATYLLLTQKLSSSFSQDKIIIQTLWQKQVFETSLIEDIYLNNKNFAKTKQVENVVYKIVIKFKDGQTLDFYGRDINIPFEAFFTILQCNLIPQTPTNIVWQKEKINFLTKLFFKVSLEDFAWYFEGESEVNVTSIYDICRWLEGCEYVSDKKLFMKDEFWQHPLTFEQIQKGDCEDHALWTWRKLVELGINAEFTMGEIDNEQGEQSGHAWVMFEYGNKNYLFESVNPMPQMIIPLEKAKGLYTPRYSVNQDLTIYQYK